MPSNLQKQAERTQFAARLAESLKTVRTSNLAEFTREFNLRSGSPPVTVHAVRKWFNGDSIPTQEKIQILAALAGVSAPWLRFGDVNNEIPPHILPDSKEVRDIRSLVNDVSVLDAHGRHLLQGIIKLLLEAQAGEK